MNPQESREKKLPNRETLSREVIVATAVERIRELGGDALSLRQLASELGVTAPALYAHVDNKTDLLRAIAATGYAELADRYGYLATADPLDRVKAHWMAYVDLAVDEPELFRVMIMFSPSAVASEDRAPQLDAASEAFDISIGAVTGAIETGEIHPERDVMETALTLWVAAHGAATVLTMGVARDDSTRVDLQRTVMETVLAGLRQPPESALSQTPVAT